MGVSRVPSSVRLNSEDDGADRAFISPTMLHSRMQESLSLFQIAYIIADTSFMAVVLLLAKGWAIVRESLSAMGRYVSIGTASLCTFSWQPNPLHHYATTKWMDQLLPGSSWWSCSSVTVSCNFSFSHGRVR